MQVPTASAPARLPRALHGFRSPVLALLFGLLAACTNVKLVADYDAEAAKAITETSAEVFTFYDKLIEAKAKAGAAKLPYSSFAEDWGRIETRIRVLIVREESRPLNSESRRIARTILEFWQKHRAGHQKSDDYVLKLAVVHRDRYQRLFTAALLAEKAKSLATADSDATKDEEEP